MMFSFRYISVMKLKSVGKKGKYASVNWLLRSFEISPSANHLNEVGEREVFYSYANYDSEVKLSSILERCQVSV